MAINNKKAVRLKSYVDIFTTKWPVGANKTGVNFMILFLKIVCNTLYIHDFSAWPRTGSYPADINGF